jgi:hypothetical protein
MRDVRLGPSCSARAVAAVLFGLISAPSTQSQEIGSAKRLVNIRAVRVATLPDSMSASDVQTPRMLVDSKGRYYQKNWRQRRFFVFDSTGKLLATFGRRGTGSGDLASFFEAVIGPGDSIHTFEHLGKHSVFAPDSFSFVRSSPSPDVSSVVALGKGRFAAVIRYPPDYKESPTDDEMTRLSKATLLQYSSIAVLGGQNKELNVLGRPHLDDHGRLAEPQPVTRAALCASPAGTMWSPFLRLFKDYLDSPPYRMEEWSSEGKLLRTITHAADWGRQPRNMVQPFSHVRWCSVDSDGRLWIYATIANPDIGDRLSHKNMFRTVVEVIDLTRRVVIASQVFPEQFLGVLDGQRAFLLRENPGGERSIDVLQLQVDLTDAADRKR